MAGMMAGRREVRHHASCGRRAGGLLSRERHRSVRAVPYCTAPARAWFNREARLFAVLIRGLLPDPTHPAASA